MRKGPWINGRKPGFQNAETETVMGGDPLMMGRARPDQADQWGGGYRRNFMPDWHDFAGNRIDPETGLPQTREEMITGRPSSHRFLGRDARGPVQQAQPRNPWLPAGAPNPGPPAGGGGHGPIPTTGGNPGGQTIYGANGGPFGGGNWTGSFEPWQGGNDHTTSTPPQPGAPGSGGSGMPGNFGQPMSPWLMPYEGDFTAPMSPWETGSLGGYGEFVGGGQGLGGARDYLGDVLGGKYLNFDSNPWLQEIKGGLGTMKQYQDADALKRIGSSMAGGGNALSGANAGAQADYLGQSGGRFQELIGNLMNQNYGMERGFMDHAPGQLAGLAGQEGAGWQQLFNMGHLPRELQQHDLNSQYDDWNRQVGGMRDDFRYPDQMLMALLSGGGFRGQFPKEYGSSPGDILGGLAGSTDWSWLSDLFGGAVDGYQGAGGNDGIPLGNDGEEPLGYDGQTSTGPKGYYDKDWYNTALTSAQKQQHDQQTKKPPSNTAAGIIALLMQLLGGGGGGNGKKKTGTSLGTNAGQALGQLAKGLFGPKQSGGPKATNPYAAPIGPNAYDPSSFVSGSSADQPFNTFDQGAWDQTTSDFFGGSGFTLDEGGNNSNSNPWDSNPDSFSLYEGPGGSFDPGWIDTFGGGDSGGGSGGGGDNGGGGFSLFDGPGGDFDPGWIDSGDSGGMG